MNNLCTVIVATRNRPAFVARLLDHMALTGLAASVIIGDGSDAHRAHETRTVAEGRTRPFHLEYRQYGPETALWQRVGLIADTVVSPYLAWVADDDFLIPEALQDAVEVLESASDLAGVSGLDGCFNVVGNAVRGVLGNCWFGGGPCRDEADATLRTLNHFRFYYPCAYAIRRTALVRRNTALFRAAGWNDDYSNNLCEVADGVLSAATGRLTALPRALYFRQQHEASESQALRAQWSPFDMLAIPRWSDTIRDLENWLVERLAESGGGDQDLNRRAVRAGLWYYYSRYLPSGVDAEMAMVERLLTGREDVSLDGRLLSRLKQSVVLRRLISSWRVHKAIRRLSDDDRRAFQHVRAIVENSQP